MTHWLPDTTRLPDAPLNQASRHQTAVPVLDAAILLARRAMKSRVLTGSSNSQGAPLMLPFSR
ncbi:MAG: hypothetical protein LC660_07945 [Desulfobacteraceae bacterium]|nr:hypothetical protein [Desulfobacteraceae bacterium]